MECFSFDEIHKLVQFKGKRCRASLWLKILYSFGLSIPELTELRVRDVNLLRGTIQIGGKYHRARTLPIPKSLVSEIKNALVGKDKEDYLFHGRYGKVHPRTVQKALERFTHSMGLYFSIRKLRNTLIHDLYHSGWDDRSIAFQLGHSSLRSTRRSLRALSSTPKDHPLDSFIKRRV